MALQKDYKIINNITLIKKNKLEKGWLPALTRKAWLADEPLLSHMRAFFRLASNPVRPRPGSTDLTLP